MYNDVRESNLHEIQKNTIYKYNNKQRCLNKNWLFQ